MLEPKPVRKNMVDPTNERHPKNHLCDKCGAKPGEWCRSKNGRLKINYGQQHMNRHRKAGYK